jgi:peptidoglycan/LPS O-acetylase OafA/YrhL
VLVFFVLSGYLITRLLWRAESASIGSYRRFVWRRVVRLYPALVGVVVVAAPLMAWIGPEQMRVMPAGVAMVLTQSTALVHVFGTVPAQGWLHTWSLTVEWVFYLVWPLLVLLLKRRGVNAGAARRFTLSLGLLLYLMSLPLSPLAFYYLPSANVPLMLLGATAALAHAQSPERKDQGRDPGVVSLAFLLFALMVLLPSSTSGLWIYRVTVYPAAAVVAYVIIDQRPGTQSFVDRILRWRPLVAVGLSSYSLYLWHLPVLWIVWWGLPELSPVARALTALVALIPLVYLSFRYLERPWLRLPATKPHSGSLPSPSRVRAVET